ncbi:MAG: ABC transporter permease [Chloroflexota bacterium]|nr:ABC transporter permease [Chloroflexota bacterium]
MTAYLIRRIGQSVVLLLLVTVVTFLLIHKAPGGPSILLSPDTPRDQQQQIAQNLGLNDPLPVQYARWFTGLVRLDLGVSYTQQRDVTAVIRTRLPATLTLAGLSFLFALLVAIPLGVLAAVRRNSIFDHLAAFISLFGVAVPVFWYGLLLIILCSVWLHLLPSGGLADDVTRFDPLDRARHLIMPTLVLSTTAMAQFTRYMRSSMVTVLQDDYVRTARAKGLKERIVLSRHALRNALIPVVTIIGVVIPRLIGGAAITENVFSYPGMGSLAVDSARQRDYPVVMGVTLLVGFVVILGNLLTDLLYGWIDPRIRLGGAGETRGG